MTEYFYQIKGKTSPEQKESGGFYPGDYNWVWPPIFSGKVTANDKKEAKALVEAEYNKKFPLRVLKKDLDNNEFLLHIRELNDASTRSLFDIKYCLNCGTEFRVIDHYNNHSDRYKGRDFCCQKCKDEDYETKRLEYIKEREFNGEHQPIIYKITNKRTGQCYIGKTTQAFTLRWYQHFFQGSGTKFHQVIKESLITDWTFEVIEVIAMKKADFGSLGAMEKHILERESFWMNEYDSINNGYNSVISDKSQKKEEIHGQQLINF